VAWIAEAPLDISLLQRASARSGSGAAFVLNRLIEARTLGLFAERGGLERGRRLMVVRAVLARALLERMEAQSNDPATPTDAEVAAMTSLRWTEFDRPEARRTCHALVRGEKLDDSSGLALAERLADGLRQFSDCVSFLERARAFSAAGANIVAEELPAVTPDGRTLKLDTKGELVDAESTFDEDFARAAHQIKSVGTQSGVVRTRFGWHIILLAEKIAPKQLPFDDRRRLLSEEILRKRAKDANLRWIAESRKSTPINVERAAVEAIGRVQVTP